MNYTSEMNGPTSLLMKPILFFQKWAIPGIFFFIFDFSLQLTVNDQYKFVPMIGFELRTSGIGSNCSTN